jgi:hypothetical protein
MGIAATPAPGPLVVHGRVAHGQRKRFVSRNNGIGLVVCLAAVHAYMLFGINKVSPGRTLTSTLLVSANQAPATP